LAHEVKDISHGPASSASQDYASAPEANHKSAFQSIAGDY